MDREREVRTRERRVLVGSFLMGAVCVGVTALLASAGRSDLAAVTAVFAVFILGIAGMAMVVTWRMRPRTRVASKDGPEALEGATCERCSTRIEDAGDGIRCVRCEEPCHARCIVAHHRVRHPSVEEPRELPKAMYR